METGLLRKDERSFHNCSCSPQPLLPLCLGHQEVSHSSSKFSSSETDRPYMTRGEIWAPGERALRKPSLRPETSYKDALKSVS
jgi:hypothetical protein